MLFPNEEIVSFTSNLSFFENKTKVLRRRLIYGKVMVVNRSSLRMLIWLYWFTGTVRRKNKKFLKRVYFVKYRGGLAYIILDFMVRNHAERKWKGSKFRNIKQSSINEKKNNFIFINWRLMIVFQAKLCVWFLINNSFEVYLIRC